MGKLNKSLLNANESENVLRKPCTGLRAAVTRRQGSQGREESLSAAKGAACRSSPAEFPVESASSEQGPSPLPWQRRLWREHAATSETRGDALAFVLGEALSVAGQKRAARN